MPDATAQQSEANFARAESFGAKASLFARAPARHVEKSFNICLSSGRFGFVIASHGKALRD
jgi:hypothetical protein